MKLHFHLTEEVSNDYFESVYSNTILNTSMILIYILGLISCVGLRLVSWFERSGQAGPYRTLVNRLMSITLDEVSLHLQMTLLISTCSFKKTALNTAIDNVIYIRCKKHCRPFYLLFAINL